MDRAEFLKIAGSLSPEEKAAVFGTVAQARTGTAAHKWSHLADALSDAEVPKVVTACRNGLKYVADHPDEGDAEGKGVQFLQDVAPALAAASANSCRYRQKPAIWGLTRIPEYLQSETFQAKRDAAKRRVPPAGTDDAAITKPDRPERKETPAVKESKAT